MLHVLYPMLPGAPRRGAEVTWDNAERLLLLADKWDLAATRDEVERFVRDKWESRSPTSTRSDLSEAELAERLRWLCLASRVGMPCLFIMLAYELVQRCNMYSHSWQRASSGAERPIVSEVVKEPR